MFNRKEIKRIAKKKLKVHYVIFTVACLIAAFFSVNYSSSMSQIKSYDNEVTITDQEIEQLSNTDTVLSNLLSESLSKGEEVAEGFSSENKKQDYKIGPVSIGYRKGIFAGIANTLSSGSLLVIIYKGISQSLNAGDLTAKITVVAVTMIMAILTSLFKGFINVTYRRLFLEGYNYKEVKAPRFLFLIKNGKWLKAAWISFVKEFYQSMWNFTIIGGIIKHFSYSQTYYITAENPNISPNKAITLSRKMMYGHKWEMFINDLTFIGWDLLNALTFGITGIFFSNAYQETYLAEYYVYLRNEAIANKYDGYEIFNDKYLYEYASEEQLIATYPDIYGKKDNEVKFPELKGVKGFFARNMGLVLSYDAKSEAYNNALVLENEIEQFKDIFNLENYPGRLSPIPDEKHYQNGDSVIPNRIYSLTSLVMMFFIFAFVGWAWEVMLHIVKDGVFVNRGTLHGPWLPIYGGGVLLILVLLYRTRKSIPFHFVSTIVLCGLLEYYSAYFLEMTKGIKWWDYTGYFLNIHGRICAEGLLVFGIGGTAAVYILAPILDNQIKKVNNKILVPLCVILFVIFMADTVYSSSHPNVGKGITDYEEDNTPQVSATSYEYYDRMIC